LFWGVRNEPVSAANSLLTWQRRGIKDECCFEIREWGTKNNLPTPSRVKFPVLASKFPVLSTKIPCSVGVGNFACKQLKALVDSVVKIPAGALFSQNSLFFSLGHSIDGVSKISLRDAACPQMIGTTRSRVSFFMNKFRELCLIDYNGGIEVHSSLLNVVLHDQPQIKT